MRGHVFDPLSPPVNSGNSINAPHAGTHSHARETTRDELRLTATASQHVGRLVAACDALCRCARRRRVASISLVSSRSSCVHASFECDRSVSGCVCFAAPHAHHLKNVSAACHRFAALRAPSAAAARASLQHIVGHVQPIGRSLWDESVQRYPALRRRTLAQQRRRREKRARVHHHTKPCPPKFERKPYGKTRVCATRSRARSAHDNNKSRARAETTRKPIGRETTISSQYQPTTTNTTADSSSSVQQQPYQPLASEEFVRVVLEFERCGIASITLPQITYTRYGCGGFESKRQVLWDIFDLSLGRCLNVLVGSLFARILAGDAQHTRHKDQQCASERRQPHHCWLL